MRDFYIPSFQIDVNALPPPISTMEPGSFARRTFEVRIPRIIEETIALNSFPPKIRAALNELRTEIVSGQIRGLRENAPDRDFWNALSRDYIGRTWLEAPWYWAEAFFYRRVLEATCYFQAGSWQSVDPFAPKKQTEWGPDAAPQLVNAALASLPSDREARFEAFLHASLWGNRVDLSHDVAMQMSRAVGDDDQSANLLVNDTAAVWTYLQDSTRGHVLIIADNAGTELLMDLALADFLLRESFCEEVSLHLKPQPFFVSDAMSQDVEAGLQALALGGDAARRLATQLREHLGDGRLRLGTHWAYATSLCYFQLPDHLRRELGAMDLVILKGDANYRRLVGDVHWPPTASFQQITDYFPAPLVALRTLKSELIVGLQGGVTVQLSAEDPDWMVNGKRGVVQANLRITRHTIA